MIDCEKKLVEIQQLRVGYFILASTGKHISQLNCVTLTISTHEYLSSYLSPARRGRSETPDGIMKVDQLIFFCNILIG